MAKQVLILIWMSFGSVAFAQSPCTAPPRLYNEDSLHAVYTVFMQNLHPERMMQDYPRAIQLLLSTESQDQIQGISILRETEDSNILPWMIMMMNSSNRNVKVEAFYAIEQLVVNAQLKKQSKRKEDHPETENDYSPLAWLLLQKLRNFDMHPNEASYAATMAGYLELKMFKYELIDMLKSRHPAVVRSADYALKQCGWNEK